MQHVLMLLKYNKMHWNAYGCTRMHKNAYGKKPHHFREKTPLIPGKLNSKALCFSPSPPAQSAPPARPLPSEQAAAAEPSHVQPAPLLREAVVLLPGSPAVAAPLRGIIAAEPVMVQLQQSQSQVESPVESSEESQEFGPYGMRPTPSPLCSDLPLWTATAGGGVRTDDAGAAGAVAAPLREISQQSALSDMSEPEDHVTAQALLAAAEREKESSPPLPKPSEQAAAAEPSHVQPAPPRREAEAVAHAAMVPPASRAPKFTENGGSDDEYYDDDKEDKDEVMADDDHDAFQAPSGLLHKTLNIRKNVKGQWRAGKVIAVHRRTRCISSSLATAPWSGST